MAFATKQYGFVFALPWGILLLRPAILALWEKWRAGERGLGIVMRDRRIWLPPAALAVGAGLLVLPLALLSPKAFWDAAIMHHTNKLPLPMLGTPQWNESLPAQIVALEWLSVEDAAGLGRIAFAVLAIALLAGAALRVRDAASALMWSVLLSGVLFAVNSGSVQFFYWRLVLLLVLLYAVVATDDGQPAVSSR
jgi:hypothetical protein